MEITLGDATKLLDNIMANYSQWHTGSSSNKVHAIEEINVLSGKMDELMKLFVSKSAPIDPNNISPKCGKFPIVTVNSGVNGEFILTQSQLSI